MGLVYKPWGLVQVWDYWSHHPQKLPSDQQSLSLGVNRGFEENDKLKLICCLVAGGQSRVKG